MLEAITSFFDNRFGTRDDSAGEQQRAQRLQLASAALMIELSKADQSIDDVEIAALADILQTRFDLDEDDLAALMQLAEEEVRDATSLYQFTSLINDNFDYEEKMVLIRNMWEVAYADGRIDRYEEHLIRKVADLLYLSHMDFIKCKKLARKPGTSA